MAKAIKRVGVIFLAVAIICLMAIGVLLGATSAKKENANLLGSSNKIENVSETSEVEIPLICEEVLLDGESCEEQAAKWNEAIEKSLANGGGNHILVTMENDWIAASNVDYIMSFGNGVGISDGCIQVPQGSTITLDLNGHTIDRNMKNETSATAQGCISISGLMILKDSKYNSTLIKEAYENDPENENLLDIALTNGAGCITGAYMSGGGAVRLFKNSRLFMYGGVVYGNITLGNGAGVRVFDSAEFTLFDGMIANNESKSSAGGVCGGGVVYGSVSASKVYIKNGFIYNNSATISNGGIYVYNSVYFEIVGGVIAHNKCVDDAAGVFVHSTEFYMSDGIIANNYAGTDLVNGSPCGGGLCTVRVDNAVITGGKIINNFARCLGAGIFNNNSNITIKNVLVTGNTLGNYTAIRGGAGIESYNPGEAIFNLGAGVQAYGNYDYNGNEDNFRINISIPINIIEPLMQDGKTTRIGMQNNLSVFTVDYEKYNSGVDPSRYFFADDSGYVITKNSAGEAQIGAGTKPTAQISWNYDNQSTTNSSVILPYKQDGYTISSSVGNFKNSSGETSSSFVVSDAGTYSFYADGTYLNPTFMVTIEDPITKIEKPVQKKYGVLYNGKYQIFEPEGFDENTMDISYNVKKELGQYTALVRLKNVWNSIWSDGTTESVEYSFEIIQPGIMLKESANIDYIYKDSNNQRRGYKEDNILHKFSDNEITDRYVIGNIATNTRLESIISVIENDTTFLKLYDNKGKKVFDGVLNDSNKNIVVSTGFKIEYYWENKLYDEVYLSVLGDVVADGVINTLDITYINRIARGEIKLETLSIEEQLAAMVDNKGKVTSTDGKILLNVIGGNTEVDNYFENVAKKDNYQLLNLKEEGGKTFRENIDITVLNLVNNAIIGNIAPNTKASEFKTKLAAQLGVDISAIEIYKANRAIANDNDYIGTGYYITYNGKTIYLSVLGDLTGDGIVNTMDVTYLNRIISGNVKLNTNDIKDKLIMLSAIIQNKGNLTTADSETLLNYIGGSADMTKYF